MAETKRENILNKERDRERKIKQKKKQKEKSLLSEVMEPPIAIISSTKHIHYDKYAHRLGRMLLLRRVFGIVVK